MHYLKFIHILIKIYILIVQDMISGISLKLYVEDSGKQVVDAFVALFEHYQILQTLCYLFG